MKIDSLIFRLGGSSQRTSKKICKALEIKKTDKVLDVGCGTGNVTTQIKKYGSEVIGLDNYMEVLKIAKDKKESSGIGFVFADLNRSLPFKDKTFDKISANLVFHLLTEHQKTFEELFRILKPRGRFVMTNITLLGPVKIFKVYSKLKFLELIQEHSKLSVYSYLIFDLVISSPRLIITGLTDILFVQLRKILGWRQIFAEDQLFEMAQKSGFKIKTIQLVSFNDHLLTSWEK